MNASINILIVDDDPSKAERVISGLTETISYADLNFTKSDCAIDAKKKLRKNTYDLLILDVALPNRKDDTPSPRGGLDLLNEIVSRPNYLTPKYIVGLTAYSEVYDNLNSEFQEDLWSLVYYNDASEVWLQRIERKILHIISLLSGVDQSTGFECDVCVVAALNDELIPLMSNGWRWELIDVPGDPMVYKVAEFNKNDGSIGKIVAAKSPLMGMVPAASLAMKMGFHFKPKIMAMIGICAGDSEDTNFGDVIFGSPVWDYGSGKLSRTDDGEKWEPAVYQVNITTSMRGIVERVQNDGQLFFNIHKNFVGTKPQVLPKALIGPVASGSAVIADKEKFKSIQDQQHRKLLGLEMEAYGVILATQELPAPTPQCLILKSVQDYADQDKNDKYRTFACYVSAQVMTNICEKHLT